ncbi:MAG: pyridoxal-phosphate dependent enzyme [Anaerolineae bacterium]
MIDSGSSRFVSFGVYAIMPFMMGTQRFICQACGTVYPLDTREWRCACGGLFDLESWPCLDPVQIDTTQPGLWRYHAWLPLASDWKPLTLGEGWTPLVPVEWDGYPVWFKVESLSPTGSFKDRGAAVLVTALRGLGIERVVEDSSGNAGASLAAYAARAGMKCEICVPSTAAGPKIAQMVAYGAEVVQIKGKREYAALAAWAAAAHGTYYASHVYHPYFLAGIGTFSYELWEQRRDIETMALVFPVGNGTFLLGAYRGFQRLHQAGLISRIPTLYGVQAAACAPIAHAFVHDRHSIEPVAIGTTVASGIAIGQPVRGAEVLAVVRATGGAVVSVEEDEIKNTYECLAARGFYVEETAAAAVAALPQLRERLGSASSTVVPLTGHGLKTYQALWQT